ncbi:MAG TPA: pyridoxamine 5'-phosphate oxidase family protein [Thermomicrobiales bacterium]|nr:pyridoxamine 5'-phosphate oxidase family protein [Thermomicrobiales bacterium]
MGTIFVLPPAEIETLLGSALVGRIACWSPDLSDGRPHLVPLAYGYDGEAIYAHSGPGRKIAIMRTQPLISFEVDDVQATDRWRSVVAEGTYEEITDHLEREPALRFIYPEPVPIPPLPSDTIVFRLRLTAKSGRFEVPDSEALPAEDRSL